MSWKDVVNDVVWHAHDGQTNQQVVNSIQEIVDAVERETSPTIDALVVELSTVRQLVHDEEIRSDAVEDRLEKLEAKLKDVPVVAGPFG